MALVERVVDSMPSVEGGRDTALAAFMSEYHGMTWPSPLGGRDRFWSYAGSDQKPLPLIITEMSPWEGHVRLWHIISPEEQGTGQASFVLEKLTALADKHGVVLTLVPKPFGRVENKLTRPKLTAWFKRHGWVCRGQADMVRNPRR